MLLWLTLGCTLTLGLRASETKVFLVTESPFSAIADGVTDNTRAIQAAINAAGKSGGTVEFPAAAKPYACGALKLTSGIHLKIDDGATLQMLPYKTYAGTEDFMSGRDLHDVVIEGAGKIDGLGAPWWKDFDDKKISRPKAMISFTNCSHIQIRDITLTNPPNTHIQLRGACEQVAITGIAIATPEKAHNTDGIDVSGRKILIDHCTIACGDDNIAMGGSSTASSDIRITNCFFGHGHGLSIGSHTSGSLQNLVVDQCRFEGTQSGIRMKSARDRGGLVQNLSYSNITMVDVDKPIYITSYYPNNTMPKSPTDDKGQAIGPKTPFWKDIVIRNLTANTENKAFAAGVIWGLPEAPIENLTLDNVKISASHGMTIVHVKGFGLTGGTAIKASTGEEPLITHDVK